MTPDDWIARDGYQWEYVCLLAHEIEKQKRRTKQWAIRFSLGLNLVFLPLLIWLFGF
jgi:hypothetical protein